MNNEKKSLNNAVIKKIVKETYNEVNKLKEEGLETRTTKVDTLKKLVNIIKEAVRENDN